MVPPPSADETGRIGAAARYSPAKNSPNSPGIPADMISTPTPTPTPTPTEILCAREDLEEPCILSTVVRLSRSKPSPPPDLRRGAGSKGCGHLGWRSRSSSPVVAVVDGVFGAVPVFGPRHRDLRAVGDYRELKNSTPASTSARLCAMAPAWPASRPPLRPAATPRLTPAL